MHKWWNIGRIWVKVFIFKIMKFNKYLSVFRGGGPYHIETSLLICSANQWTGFYRVFTSAMKELKCHSRCLSLLKVIY